jgi:NADPH:quinone reductase-like Zn-dependent oxidoreductase
MKAIVFRAYGGPDRLEQADLPAPEPGPGEVLVRVRASSVNPIDLKLASGRFRPFLRAHFPQVPGYDVAGEVERWGPGVTGLSVGERVHARLAEGAASAEFVLAQRAELVAIPAGMDDATAAGLPLAGMTALQGLRNVGEMPLEGASMRVLVLGASGGVGHLAVQIARAAGAIVVAVCSARNSSLVESLGAHEVFDYSAPAPYHGLRPCDLILDCVGEPASAWLSHLREGGRYASMVPGPSLFARMLVNGLTSKKVRPVLLQANADDLRILDGLVTAGKLRVIVDRRVPLERLRDAWERSRSGRTSGKIIVDVAPAT